jgi:hypothetical protein
LVSCDFASGNSIVSGFLAIAAGIGPIATGGASDLADIAWPADEDRSDVAGRRSDVAPSKGSDDPIAANISGDIAMTASSAHDVALLPDPLSGETTALASGTGVQ